MNRGVLLKFFILMIPSFLSCLGHLSTANADALGTIRGGFSIQDKLNYDPKFIHGDICNFADLIFTRTDQAERFHNERGIPYVDSAGRSVYQKLLILSGSEETCSVYTNMERGEGKLSGSGWRSISELVSSGTLDRMPINDVLGLTIKNWVFSSDKRKTIGGIVSQAPPATNPRKLFTFSNDQLKRNLVFNCSPGMTRENIGQLVPANLTGSAIIQRVQSDRTSRP